MNEMRHVTHLPLRVFYSYADEDELLLDKLEYHLSGLQRQGLIRTWHHHQIVAGADRVAAVNTYLSDASIILLLVSPAFLASEYCHSVELQKALELHATGRAFVIPILLRPVDYRGTPFAQLQYLPRNGHPITTWVDQDEAFFSVAKEIRALVEYKITSSASLDSLALPSASYHSTSSTTQTYSREAARAREQILDRVQRYWIHGLLEQSLHGAALIQLDLQEQPDALANPWRLVVQELNQPPRDLSPETHISQIYDTTDGQLLILGKPGSGKTTLLLELARVLLIRAKQNSDYSIPIIFNLSSWKTKQQPLANWIIEELQSKYDIPYRIGQIWVETNQILLLFDGLDEIIAENISECVDAINGYKNEHNSSPVIICCRQDDYFSQKIRIRLNCAIVIQPLTPQQIDMYLSSAKGQLDALRVALQDDSVLRELVVTPLMLSILALTYHGKSIHSIHTEGSFEHRRRVIFATYVQRMLQRRAIVANYTPQQTQIWLTWLAKQMQRDGRTEFYMERMQPDWLSESQFGWRYGRFILGIILALLGVAVGGLFGGTFGGVVGGLIGGICGGIASSEIEPVEVITLPQEKFLIPLIKSLIGGVGLGAFLGLIASIPYGLVSGLTAGLIIGSILGLIIGSIMVVGGEGIVNKRFDKYRLTTPNQGIKRSIYNSIFAGIGIGVLTGLAPGLALGIFFGFLRNPQTGLIVGLSPVLIFGIIAGLIKGGFAALQHFVLRLLLWRSGCIPWNYTRFLDYASDRILLRKVGGSYIFIHRLLLEYFASLDPPQTLRSLPDQK